MSMDGKRRRDYLPGLSDEERKRVYYYAVFPNLFLSLHPDYVMTHTLWPRAVDRTDVVCEWHFHPAEMAKTDFVGTDAVEFWDVTNREDWPDLRAVASRNQLACLQTRSLFTLRKFARGFRPDGFGTRRKRPSLGCRSAVRQSIGRPT